MSWIFAAARVTGGLTGALLALVVLPGAADAQFLRKAKETAKRAAEGETLNQLDRTVREQVRCAFDDVECIREAEESGEGAVLTDDNGEILVDEAGDPVTDPDRGAEVAGATEAGITPGQGAWANYDFQPGDEILVYDDFSGDEVGDFPRRFELIEGTFEVIEWTGGRYLRATSGGIIALPLPRTLPERFTLEYSASIQHGNAYLRVMPGRAYYGPGRSYQGSVLTVEATRAGIRPAGAGPSAMAKVEGGRIRDGVVPVRIMADGEHVKMYVGEQRVANVPNAVFPRSDTLFLAVSSAAPKHPVLVGPIRIAGGGRDLYDQLAKEGRVATQGILFATNSARIRPESTPTLQEIGQMLQDHADLRISIEGHTDSDGETAFNQALSQRRAAAVKAFIVETYRVDENRMRTAGFGESRPLTDNATPEAKQQNRRVELVLLDRQ